MRTVKKVIRKSKGKKVNQEVSLLVQRALRRNEEHKFFDTTVSSSPGTTQTVFALTQNIVQGVTGGTRIGNVIRLQRLLIKTFVQMASTATFTSAFRVIVFRDKENRGVFPIAGDVVLNGNVTALYSPPVVQEKRIIILYDRMFSLNTTGQQVDLSSRSINLNGLQCFYNGTANAATDNGKNSLWLLIWGSDNVHPAGCTADFEVQFTDA
jgi:hypothetical protein